MLDLLLLSAHFAPALYRTEAQISKIFFSPFTRKILVWPSHRSKLISSNSSHRESIPFCTSNLIFSSQPLSFFRAGIFGAKRRVQMVVGGWLQLDTRKAKKREEIEGVKSRSELMLSITQKQGTPALTYLGRRVWRRDGMCLLELKVQVSLASASVRSSRHCSTNYGRTLSLFGHEWMLSLKRTVSSLYSRAMTFRSIASTYMLGIQTSPCRQLCGSITARTCWASSR